MKTRLWLALVCAFGGFAVGAAAQSEIGFGVLNHHEVTAQSPCGGWFWWNSETVTPFVRNGDIWLMTRCSDGRLFLSQFPIMTAGPTMNAKH
jgi:hypothetical protein